MVREVCPTPTPTGKLDGNSGDGASSIVGGIGGNGS